MTTNAYDPVKLRAMLGVDEGVRAMPYVDTVGKITIGIGRNLSAVGMSQDEIDLCYRNDVARAEKGLDTNVPWWRSLDPVRQLVLLNMAFNMGVARPGAGLLSFVNTLHNMSIGNYVAAADGMASSKWAGQVGARADRLIAMMKTGVAS